jgi:hypothetical protein
MISSHEKNKRNGKKVTVIKRGVKPIKREQ